MLKSINLSSLSPTADSATASVSSYGGVSSVATLDLGTKPMTIRQFTSWATLERADPESLVNKLREVQRGKQHHPRRCIP